MRLLLVRPSAAFLPEINAYRQALISASFEVEITDPSTSRDMAKDADLVYRFGGLLHQNISRTPEIHEYASLSTGQFPRVRNFAKARLNSKPVARVFQSELVRNGFRFDDNLPFIFRDMGVNQTFWEVRDQVSKKFDFVYVGSIDGRPGVKETLLRLATKGFRLLVAGKAGRRTANALASTTGLSFLGPLPPEKVPEVVALATHGLDLRPSSYPHPFQTSTKVLEYLAAGLTVVSESYPWIESHSLRFGYRFVSLNQIERFRSGNIPTTEPLDLRSVQKFGWNSILNESKFVEFVAQVASR